MSNKKVSQLDSALSIALLDLLLLTQVDGNAETGYASKKITVSDLANKLNSDIQYATDLPDFTDKTITGALQELKDMLISQIPVITTSPAPIANFSTDLALPLKSLVANIKATGGNGTPTTPVPIVGFSSAKIYHRGKNLIDLSSLVAGYVNTDGTFNTSQTQGEMRSGFISVKPNTTYFFSIKETSSSYNAWLRVGQYSSEDTSSFIQSNSYWTFTTTATTKYIVVSARNLADATKIQLELGSTETAYEPYQGNTHTIDLGQTVYGGEVDVTNGKLKDKSSSLVDLSSLSWQKTTVGGHDCFYAALSGAPKISSFFGLCTTYGISADTTMSADNTIKFYGSDSYNFARCLIRDDSLGSLTAEQFKSSVTGSIVYELVTPLEYDLTPEEITAEITAFLGINNFWSDTNGDISASYRESIQKYIDEQIASVQALVL